MSSSVHTYPMTNAAEKNRLESTTNQEAAARVDVWENYDQSFYTFEGDPVERQQSVQEQSNSSINAVESPMEKKKRRRIRRRRRIAAGAAAGLIIGIILPTGPIAVCALAVGGGVAARVISKRREYKKDQRLAEQNPGVTAAPSLSPATVE